MSPEAQRIAIAGWREWKETRQINQLGEVGWPYPGLWIGRNPTTGYMGALRDYLNDLNAIRGAVIKLPTGLAAKFWLHLHRRITDHEYTGHWRDLQAVGQATASELSEMLLRTIGKWEDDK